jgi:hypothetical protein
MAIPHWLIGLAMLLAAGAFVVFAFRQGQRVKPGKNKRVDDLQGGGGIPPLGF